MKTSLRILLVLLLSFPVVSHASHPDVLVYKKRLTFTETGGGSIVRQAITGWTVIDTETATVYEIDAYPSRGRFNIFQPVLAFTTLSGGIGKVFTVRSDAFQEFYDGGGTHMFSTVIKGRNVPLDIFTQIFNAPKTFNLTERVIFEDDTGVQFIDEVTGKLTFDKTNTQDANILDLTLDQTVDALAQILINKGFIEE